jgi:hypothetical protein
MKPQESGKAHPLSGIGQSYLTACFWTGLVCHHYFLTVMGVKGHNFQRHAGHASRPLPVSPRHVSQPDWHQISGLKNRCGEQSPSSRFLKTFENRPKQEQPV